MPQLRIRKVAVLGAGVMGAQIAAHLVNEVFRRRMDEMSERRLALLREAREQRPGDLEAILAAFVEPALALTIDRHGGSSFVRVIARAYAEKNDRLRKFLSDNYGHVLREEFLGGAEDAFLGVEMGRRHRASIRFKRVLASLAAPAGACQMPA